VRIAAEPALTFHHGRQKVRGELRLGLEERREGEVRIDDDDATAAGQQAPELGEHVVHARDVLEQEARQDEVEGVVGQPALRCPCLDEVHAVGLAHVRSSVRQHRLVEVEARHLRARKALEQEPRHEARAAARLEDARTVPEPVSSEDRKLLRPERVGLDAQPLELGGDVAELRLADLVRAPPGRVHGDRSLRRPVSRLLG
jgi:hypothetical protein